MHKGTRCFARPSGRRSAPVLLVAVFLAAGHAGCAATTEYQPLRFSPDGSVVVRWQEDRLIIGPDAAILGAENMFVHLYSAAPPHRKRTVKVFSDLSGLGRVIEQMIFSPDSKHLALVVHDKIVVLELATASAREVARVARTNKAATVINFIVSAAWRGNRELCYATASVPMHYRHPEERDETYRYVRAVYRQDITQPQGERKTVYKMAYPQSERTCRYLPGDCWSADGRYVIFIASHKGGGLTLLDLDSGKTHLLKSPMELLLNVAWRPDGAALVCYGLVGEDRHAWLLVDPRTGRVTDLTAPFDRAVTGQYVRFICWSADGGYLLVKAAGDEPGPEHVLIRPRPWEVIPIGKLLAEKVALAAEPAPELAAYPIRPLNACPVPGRLLVRSKEGKHFLTDYHARRLVEIPGPAISPEGKRIAVYDEQKHHLEVRELKLPAE